jgi:NTE family protein
MALGKDPHDALALDGDPSTPHSGFEPPDFTQGILAEIIGLMMSGAMSTPEGAAEIGRLAVEAETAFTEDDFVAMLRQSVGTDDWPDVDFRPTCMSCATADLKAWTAADGIPLSRAVASSNAIPGFFPAISFGEDHYVDGSRGPDPHTRIVKDLDLDAAMYIGPKIAAVEDANRRVLEDMRALAATGVRVHTILGSPRLDAAGLNLMDTTQRPLAFEIGLADGADQAAAVSELLG